LDFWSLSPGHDAFRGRGYSLAVIDEAAIVRNLSDVINLNLRPALAEHSGRLLLTSTPRGFDEFCQWFGRANREGVTMSGSTALNPKISAAELEAERRELPELVYRQEMLAEFVQLEGVVLRREEIRYGTVPEREQLVYVSFGFDLALSLKKSADQSALAICAGDDRGRRWLVHLAAWRNRWSDTVAKLLGFLRSLEARHHRVGVRRPGGRGCIRTACGLRVADPVTRVGSLGEKTTLDAFRPPEIANNVKKR
jgi:hypothetical protein